MLKRVGRVGPFTQDALARQQALRVAAEGVPAEERAAWHAAQIGKGYKAAARADPEIAAMREADFVNGHAQQVALNRAAAKYLTNVREGGTVVPRITEQRIQAVFEQAGKVAGGREALLERLDKLGAENARARISAPGRVFKGAEWVNPTAARLGERTPTLAKAVAERDQLAKLHSRALDQEATWLAKSKTRDLGPLSEQDAKARLAELDAWHQDLLKRIVPETSEYGGDLSKQEQLFRNYENSRVGKGNRIGASRQPTVKAEELANADSRLRDTIANNPGSPAAKRAGELLAERDRLQDALNARAETAFAGEEPGPLPRAPAAAHASVPRPSNPFRNRIVRLGIRLEAAQQKVDRLTAAAGRRVTPTGLVGAEDFEGGEFRVPTVPRYKGARSTRLPPPVGGSGGILEPKAPGTLVHPFTGAALRGGAIRTDVVRLMAESAHEVQRYWTLLHVVDRLKAVAKDEPTSKYDVPIVVRDLPGRPSLQETVARLEDQSTREGQLGVLSHGYEGLRQAIFPNYIRDAAGDAHPVEQVPGVKYVDERLLGGLNKPSPLLGFAQTHPRTLATIDAINNAERLAILYLKPAYIAPNLLSNVAMNVVQQGYAAPVNLTRAAKLWAKADPETVNNILASMGEGIMGPLAAETGPAAKAASFMASKFAKPVDVLPRLASFLYEARRNGVTSAGDLKALYADPAQAGKLAQITLRANREMIDFGDLTKTDQAIIRRVIFFWPWVKGSAKWLGRFPVEHPIQAGLASPISRVGAQAQQQAFGTQIPSWAQTLIPTGHTGAHGLPTSWNPFTVTPFDQTGNLLASMLAVLAGKPQQATDTLGGQYGMLTPAIGAAGTAVNHGPGAALRGLFANLPVVTETQQGLGKGSKTYPFEGTPAQAIARYLGGTGMIPRETSPAELAKSRAAELKRK